MPKDPYKLAKKKVKQKKGFYSHLASYIAVTLFFFIINIANWEGEFWFFYPVLGWGIGLAIHYFSVFGLPGTDILTKDWEERELQKEIRNMGYDPEDLREEEDDFDDDLELKEIRRETLGRKGDEDFV